MIFVGKKYWTENKCFEVVFEQAKGKEYQKYLLLTDDFEQIYQFLMKYREQQKLPFCSCIEDYKNPFSISLKFFNQKNCVQDSKKFGQFLGDKQN